MNPNPADYSKWWLPIDISTHGPDVDNLILVIHIFMAILFVGWGIFFAYCLVRFRAGANPKAQYHDVGGGISKGVEVAVVIIEAVLLVGFSMPVWARVKNEPPKESEALMVRVVAQQFQWNFHYAGPDGKFGAMNPKLVDDAENPIGIDRRNDPAAADDVWTTNNFTFPVNKPIIARISSKDVIHSFKVPVMRFTQDAIPGAVIPVWFQATKTGAYDIACAQLCGNGHTRMRAIANIVEPAQFDEWMAKKLAELGLGPDGKPK